MLENFFEINSEDYKDSPSAYRQPSFLFRWCFINQILLRYTARLSGVSSFNFVVHPEPDWQSVVENKPVVSQRWKIKWWLHFKRFYRFKRSQNYVEAEETLGINITPTSKHLSKRSASGLKYQKKMNLSLLISRSEKACRLIRKQYVWTGKSLWNCWKNWMRIMGCCVEKLLHSASVVVLLENQYMF